MTVLEHPFNGNDNARRPFAIVACAQMAAQPIIIAEQPFVKALNDLPSSRAVIQAHR